MPKSNGFNGKTINHGMHAGLSIFFKSTSTSLFTGGNVKCESHKMFSGDTGNTKKYKRDRDETPLPQCSIFMTRLARTDICCKTKESTGCSTETKNILNT
jgi:hypothetical protein